MKTVLKSALVLALALVLAGCRLSMNTQYETAQRYLGARDYALAAELFAGLGGYQDAEQCALYARALQALSEESLSRAGQDFYNLGDFKLSALYYDYVSARQLEMEGSLYEAQEGYMLLGSFLDASERSAHLASAIPEREYAAAQTLYEIGEYEKALAAFLTLDAYRDSAAMAKLCTDAIGEKNLLKIENLLLAQKYDEGFSELNAYAQSASSALRREAEAIKAKYQAIIYDKAASEPNPATKKALYGYISSYKDVPEKLAALSTVNAQAHTDGPVYALFGGQTYRVLENKEGRALLLAEMILDILPVNQEGEIYAGFDKSSLNTYLNGAFLNALTESEKAAVVSVSLPDAALARSLSAEARIAAVPDALRDKNPLLSSAQNGVWWLHDAGSLANSQMIVYYNGVIYEKGLPASDTRTGIRPLITLDTARLPFKSGSGTLEDPLK